VALLLASGGPHGARVRVPEHRLLNDPLAASEDRTLTIELGIECALDGRERIQILDLRLRAKLARANGARADVGVDAKAPLLHVDVAHLEILEQLLELTQKCACSSSRPEVRFGDDLDQRHAGSIEIDGRHAGKTIVNGFPGVLLQVDTSDPDRERLSVSRRLDGQTALRRQRTIVLRDLITLG
jgi:hypothetical protein